MKDLKFQILNLVTYSGNRVKSNSIYLVYVEWVVHVSVDQTGRVDEGDEGEALLLRRGDLRGQVVHHAWFLVYEETRDIKFRKYKSYKKYKNATN